MATVIDITALTINPLEAESVNSAVARLALENPAFNTFFTQFSGFTTAQKILLAKELGLSGKLDGGGTRPTTGGLKVAFTEKEAKVVAIGDTLYHTQGDVNQNWKPMVRKFAQDFKELDMTSEVGQFITAAIGQSVQEAMWRMAMLSDTAIDTVANGGVLLNGTDKTMFNPLNGVWKQIQTGVTATTVKKTAIAENALSTFVLQLGLASDAGLKALKGMYDTASSVLKGKTDKFFLLTPELYYNYEEYLVSQPLDKGGFSNELINGIAVLKYKGIPIYKDELTGAILKSYFQNGTKYSNPHRGILTCKENFAFYTTSDSDITKVESFYDLMTRQNVMAYLFNMDVLVLREELVTVAY